MLLLVQESGNDEEKFLKEFNNLANPELNCYIVNYCYERIWKLHVRVSSFPKRFNRLDLIKCLLHEVKYETILVTKICEKFSALLRHLRIGSEKAEFAIAKSQN